MPDLYSNMRKKFQIIISQVRDIKIGVVYISPAANREETEEISEHYQHTGAWEGYHLWRLEFPSQEVGQSLQQARKPTTLPYRLFVRHLSEIRYCQDNGTPFHQFTTYIVSFADAHHIKFIFEELGIAQAEIHDPKHLVKFWH